MKIKRYVANNMQEAMLKVKMDLGSEAVILNTKSVKKKGIFNIFSKPMTEVLAAIDEEAANGKKKNSNDVSKKLPSTLRYNSQGNSVKEKPGYIQTEIKNNSSVDEDKINALQQKVNKMEDFLEKIYNSINKKEENSKEDNNTVESISNHNEYLEKYYDILTNNEIDNELAKKIIEKAKQFSDRVNSEEDAEELMTKIISGLLGSAEKINIDETKKQYGVLITGPTGLGKTTTMAKNAANFSLNMGKSVGLITADTYRIAAVEQLKTYAEILNMPVTVIYSHNEMKDALEEHSDKDLILIDTAGRSHKNKAQLEELKLLINVTNADETFLVVSATTNKATVKDILQTYSFLDNYKLVFTKLDETSSIGCILNARYTTGKTISYITNGQSVPDDIEVANIDKITKSIIS